MTPENSNFITYPIRFMISKSTTVEQYISQQPTATREILTSLRALITTICPDAVESIAYGMPAYKLNKKPLIYFAGYDHHIGIYATPSAHQEFSKALA